VVCTHWQVWRLTCGLHRPGDHDVEAAVRAALTGLVFAPALNAGCGKTRVRITGRLARDLSHLPRLAAPADSCGAVDDLSPPF
jgi:hypothetical protein